MNRVELAGFGTIEVPTTADVFLENEGSLLGIDVKNLAVSAVTGGVYSLRTQDQPPESLDSRLLKLEMERFLKGTSDVIILHYTQMFLWNALVVALPKR